jgi:hypothetical protein
MEAVMILFLHLAGNVRDNQENVRLASVLAEIETRHIRVTSIHSSYMPSYI